MRRVASRKRFRVKISAEGRQPGGAKMQIRARLGGGDTPAISTLSFCDALRAGCDNEGSVVLRCRRCRRRTKQITHRADRHLSDASPGGRCTFHTADVTVKPGETAWGSAPKGSKSKRNRIFRAKLPVGTRRGLRRRSMYQSICASWGGATSRACSTTPSGRFLEKAKRSYTPPPGISRHVVRCAALG